MSTTHSMFTQEELNNFVKDLKEWPNTCCGNEDAEYSVSPFTSFYFLYDENRCRETSLLMVDIHEEFERMLGKPYLIATNPNSERPHSYGSKRLPDLREVARNRRTDKGFLFNFTDEKNHRSSPTTAGYFWRVRDYQNNWTDYRRKIFSTIQFYYRWSWWLEHKTEWRTFVLSVMERLQIHQAYSGFALATPLEIGCRTEVAVWERALTPYFYGLDIDSYYCMSDQLTHGIRPPTWGFLLSDYWREQLGLTREAVQIELRHPEIRVESTASGLWIELGKAPSLYPVEEGLPELPMLLNRILKPIRHDDLCLLDFGEWDGDPNERFTQKDARRWMGRFDEDSEWPSKEQRFKKPDAKEKR
ncbi:hypothetical protein FACS189487_09330 [Campylobacterota bacterium]|nr:hypothetical protein FACS189487_09330 [Campylobacterota bacterium]